MTMLELIHESNLIEGIDDEAYDKQGLCAWNYLIQRTKLTKGVVCKVQKINTLLQDDLMPHQRGYTRSMSKVNVYVGNHVAPAWSLVDGMLENWLLDMEQHWRTLMPKEMHIRFEKIHPFVDGNGRTGRMLMWWHQIRLQHKPTELLNSNKQEYYRWFQ